MGKIDTITKEYMENPVVFADAFNQFYTTVLSILRIRQDEIIKGISNFLSMERQAADVINVVTGSKLKYPKGKGMPA